MRINRFLARSGVASRRKAEELITSGQIFVNGQKTIDLSTEIDIEKDEVTISDKKITLPEYKYYLFNKPTGYTTTRNDRFARHNIFELLPDDPSLITVGRLDRETSGLIFVTNDGGFAQNVIHPTNKIEKEYIVRTQRSVSSDQVGQLEKGVELDDGQAKAKKAKKISEKEILMIIEMGRKRIVRRMIEAIGNKVMGLNRTRIGEIILDVPIGKYRELAEEEKEAYL